MKRTRTKYGSFFYTKNLFQILLWFLEIVAFPGVFVFLSAIVVPFYKDANFLDYFERYLVFYAFYQILVFILLKSINDAKKDQTLAISSLYECLQLYIETNDPSIKDYIKRVCIAQLDFGTMNSSDIRLDYEHILDLVELDNLKSEMSNIRLRLMFLKHTYESLSLDWNYSFIVRLFK